MKEKGNRLLLRLNVAELLRDGGLVFSFLSVFVGLVIGAVTPLLSADGTAGEILSLFVSFNTQLADKSKIEIFSGIALSGLLYFGLMFLFGGNIFGKELLLFVTAIKASGITAVITFLYSQYALKGLEYCLLVFMPGKIILIFAMLFLTKSCYDFSKKLRKGFAQAEENKTAVRLFSLKAVISLFILMLSWTADFLCILVFSGLFDFKQ